MSHGRPLDPPRRHPVERVNRRHELPRQVPARGGLADLFCKLQHSVADRGLSAQTPTFVMRGLPFGRGQGLVDSEKLKGGPECPLAVVAELLADQNQNPICVEVLEVLLDLQVVPAAIHEVAIEVR